MVIKRKSFSKVIIIMLAFVALTAFTAALFSGFTLVNAEEEKATTLLPLKSEEYYALSSPLHAYSDGDITVVTESKTLHIFKDGEVITKTERKSLDQIKRVNGDLYFNDFAKIYKLPIADLNAEPQFISLTGTYFDINEDYIVVIYNEVIELYKTDNLETPFRTVASVQNKPVAVNGNSMFYVAGNRICREYFSDSDTTVKYGDVVPDYMIADDQYLFYLKDGEIYRVSLEDKTTTHLTFATESNYDLGNVLSPNGISFKNGNLIITDSGNGSVQEFKINGNKLEFTGYAIARGLTAYNRISANANDIERYGKYVATLDGVKLTVIDATGYAGYDKSAFINKFVKSVPDKFALGDNTVLYLKDDTVKLANVKSDDERTVDAGIVATALNDIAYQSGTYYLAFAQGTTTTVVKVNERTGEILSEQFSGVNASLVTADVFGNIFIADNASIYKNGVAIADFSGAKKLCTDLAGNIFALKDDGKIYLVGESESVFYSTLGKIKSFALNFDSEKAYFLVEGREEIYCTDKIGNLSFNSVTKNEEYTGATAGKTELALYTVKENANVYSVSDAGNGFTFNALAEKSAEYPLIAKITVVEDKFVLYALATDKGVVLVNEKDLTPKETELADAPQKAYVTTAVYAYAIPVIEQQNSFIIKDGENAVRIGKGVILTVNYGFTLLGKTFYDATVSINGEITECYIPADFTATVLAETLEFTDYTIEKVKATTLFADSDLTEELFALNEGDSVKLLSAENGVLKVIAKDSNGIEIEGYIAENSLAENPNTTVRNILIILAVFASLAGTVSFFLLRKKTL